MGGLLDLLPERPSAQERTENRRRMNMEIASDLVTYGSLLYGIGKYRRGAAILSTVHKPLAAGMIPMALAQTQRGLAFQRRGRQAFALSAISNWTSPEMIEDVASHVSGGVDWARQSASNLRGRFGASEFGRMARRSPPKRLA